MTVCPPPPCPLHSSHALTHPVVIPDQHAAFGIAQAQQKKHEPAWKDLGLHELMTAGPKATQQQPRKLPR